MPFVDIFDSGFRTGRKVCLLAPGPNGRDHYGEIPADHQVIAISKAVLIPEVEAQIWVNPRTELEWFEEANRSFPGVRIFHVDAAREIEAELPGCESCYSFELQMDDDVCLQPHEMRPIVPGVIRGNGSISGAAIQIAYHCGAREMLLCGIDMSGDAYFDGTFTLDQHHGTTWWFTPRLNMLIRWMIERGGCQVRTLSPTRLDVARYAGE
ncbi:MAG: hypothetical protein R3325_00365 [Thermoanaerobaculia bacterium]|nr:hypothetical protein [Thermoanaerobaculia bacterium]